LKDPKKETSNKYLNRARNPKPKKKEEKTPAVAAAKPAGEC